MTDPEPFDLWFDTSAGEEIPLPGSLARLYGTLRFPLHAGRPHVVSNFVQTMDGVVTLAVPGQEGGGDISGHNVHDRVLMGILRACADVVLITSRSLEVNPKALWTAQGIDPPRAEEHRTLREALRKTEMPPHIVVTGSGDLRTDARVFHTPGLEVLVVTTDSGAERLQSMSGESRIQVRTAGRDGPLRAKTILEVVQEGFAPGLVLTEAGPHMTAGFLEEGLLDELFLTVAPQIAGREPLSNRLGFNAGKTFAPDREKWARLASARKQGEFLFLRYELTRP